MAPRLRVTAKMPVVHIPDLIQPRGNGSVMGRHDHAASVASAQVNSVAIAARPVA